MIVVVLIYFVKLLPFSSFTSPMNPLNLNNDLVLFGRQENKIEQWKGKIRNFFCAVDELLDAMYILVTRFVYG